MADPTPENEVKPASQLPTPPVTEAPAPTAAPASVPEKPATPLVELPKPAEASVAPAKAEAAVVDIDEPDDDIQDLEEGEPIEAYCVKCKIKVEMENPDPVWTSKGTPGTRGSCPTCGTTIFRMGKTPAHDKLVRPLAVKVEGNVKIATSGGRKRAQPATYINYATGDAEFAKKLATDLENAGIHTWIDTNQNDVTNVKWAAGVHPALKESAKMVVVLSPGAKNDEAVSKAWTFFKSQKKPIVLAMTSAVEVPDPLRRNPRFDFSADYKTSFRQLLSALSE